MRDYILSVTQEDTTKIGKCLLGDEISSAPSAREAKIILRQENDKERNRS